MTASLPLPKYHHIYLVLKERLLENQYESRLPGELALMEEFDAARVTVRHALANLVHDKLITRKRGRGTEVRQAPQRAGNPASSKRRSGLLDNLVHVSLGTSAQVVSLEVIAAPRSVAQSLNVAEGDLVQKAVRVRSTDLGPLSVIVTHVPLSVCRPFTEAQLSKKPLLMLLEEQGLQLGRAGQGVSARLADASQAALLDVPMGSALLCVDRVVHDQDNRPVQLLHGVYRPDRYKYEMNLSRGGQLDARVWVSTSLDAAFQ